MKFKELFKITGLPVVFASLCCLSPVILVLFGIGSVSVAASLADTLYGTYRWLFRGIGIILLSIGIFIYVRKKHCVCTLDDVKRKRNEIINVVALSIISAVVGYVFFLYVVVHYAGVFLHIWS